MRKYELEGKTYDYDGKMTVKDARFLWEKAQVGVSRLNMALFVDWQPDAIAAFMYLLKRRAGEAPRWEDADNWDITTFAPVTTDPEQLRVERQILADQIEKIDAHLAEMDESATVSEVEASSDPTPSTSGKTRRRGSGTT